jgi:hypothetical protein
VCIHFNSYSSNQADYVKITDWASAEDNAAFHASSELTSLLEAWQQSPTPITTDPPLHFVLPADQRYRLVAFQPHDTTFSEAVNAIFICNFPPDWNPSDIEPKDELTPKRPKKVVWDNAWMNFRQDVLRSEGAWIADKATEGWSTDGKCSYVGIFRFKEAASAMKLLDSTAQGVERLKILAERGLVIEVVNMLYVKTTST